MDIAQFSERYRLLISDAVHITIMKNRGIVDMASKTDKHVHLFLGTILAFLIVDGIAILAGEGITDIAPGDLIKMLSGVIFIIFGFLTLIFRNKREENHSKYHFENPFYSGFILIFVYIYGSGLLFITTRLHRLHRFSYKLSFEKKKYKFSSLC